MPRTVRAGALDSLTSIAEREGFFSPTLWEHPKNRALKELRHDPTTLQEGDEVFIPDLRPREVECAVDRVHRFVRRGIPAWFRTQLWFGEVSLSNTACTVDVDGQGPTPAETDQDGWLRIPVAVGAMRATVRVPSHDLEFVVVFGALDPVETPRGAWQRLENLGFCPPGGRDSEPGVLQVALERFQQTHGLTRSGVLDDETRPVLLQAHGELPR